MSNSTEAKIVKEMKELSLRNDHEPSEEIGLENNGESQKASRHDSFDDRGELLAVGEGSKDIRNSRQSRYCDKCPFMIRPAANINTKNHPKLLGYFDEKPDDMRYEDWIIMDYPNFDIRLLNSALSGSLAGSFSNVIHLIKYHNGGLVEKLGQTDEKEKEAFARREWIRVVRLWIAYEKKVDAKEKEYQEKIASYTFAELTPEELEQKYRGIIPFEYPWIYSGVDCPVFKGLDVLQAVQKFRDLGDDIKDECISLNGVTGHGCVWEYIASVVEKHMDVFNWFDEEGQFKYEDVMMDEFAEYFGNKKNQNEEK